MKQKIYSMKIPKDLTYEQAVHRLETIVAGFEQNTLELDHLSEQIREAQMLLMFCQKKLTKVETDVKKILDHEQE